MHTAVNSSSTVVSKGIPWEEGSCLVLTPWILYGQDKINVCTLLYTVERALTYIRMLPTGSYVISTSILQMGKHSNVFYPKWLVQYILELESRHLKLTLSPFNGKRNGDTYISEFKFAFKVFLHSIFVASYSHKIHFSISQRSKEKLFFLWSLTQRNRIHYSLLQSKYKKNLISGINVPNRITIFLLFPYFLS